MTDSDGHVLWRSKPIEDLVWAEFGAESIVYHRPSGKTHFFNAATVALLREVLTCPLPARAAAEALAAVEGAVTEDAFYAAVAASLEQLERLGLIERLDA